MRLRQKTLLLTHTSVGGRQRFSTKWIFCCNFWWERKFWFYLFQTAYRCSLVRQLPHGFWLVKSFPSKNNLCPDTVASKDEDFSANIFVKPPSPILAELPVSTHIYITFFTKRSVNSEGSLQTARPTDRWEEKCVQKHPCTFPNLKVILKPLSVSKWFSFMLSLCQSFFPREAL